MGTELAFEAVIYLVFYPFSGTKLLKSQKLADESNKGVSCYINEVAFGAPKDGDWVPGEPTL